MDASGDHQATPIRMTPCSLTRGCHQSRSHSSSLLEEVLAEKKMAIMQSPDVIQWLRTVELESFEQNNDEGLSWLQQESREHGTTHQPNTEPESYQPNTEPESYQPNTEPESYRPNTEPESYQPNTEPESYRPNTEPESYRPNTEPESYRPNTEPESYRPNTEPESYRPDPEWEYYRPNPEPPESYLLESDQPNTRQGSQHSTETGHCVTALKPSCYRGAVSSEKTCTQGTISVLGQSDATSSRDATDIMAKNISLDHQQNIKTCVKLDAVIHRQGPNNINMDAVIQGQGPNSINMDAVIQGQGPNSINMDAVIQGQRSDSINMDAVIQGQRPDSIIPATDPSSFLASCHNQSVPEAVDELQNIRSTSGRVPSAYCGPVHSDNGLDTYRSSYSRIVDVSVAADPGPNRLNTSGLNQLATSGQNQLATSGSNQLATSGLNQLATSGLKQMATSGPNQLVTSGSNQLVTSGPNQRATSGSNQLATSGPNQPIGSGLHQLISSEVFLSPDSNHLVTQWLNANLLNDSADSQL